MKLMNLKDIKIEEKDLVPVISINLNFKEQDYSVKRIDEIIIKEVSKAIEQVEQNKMETVKFLIYCKNERNLRKDEAQAFFISLTNLTVNAVCQQILKEPFELRNRPATLGVPHAFKDCVNLGVILIKRICKFETKINSFTVEIKFPQNNLGYEMIDEEGNK